MSLSRFACRLCGSTDQVEFHHLTGRDAAGVYTNPDVVEPLCRVHHLGVDRLARRTAKIHLVPSDRHRRVASFAAVASHCDGPVAACPDTWGLIANLLVEDGP